MLLSFPTIYRKSSGFGRFAGIRETVRITLQSFHAGQRRHAPPRRLADAFYEDDQADGGGDGAAGNHLRNFPDQLLHAAQGVEGRIGMEGRHAPGMAGVPSLEHGQGGPVADFADDDAVRAQPEGYLQQVGSW